MFKRLRDQFIIMHMGVVTLIVVLFFGTVLLFANTGINRSINDMLGRNHIVVADNNMPRRPDSPLTFMININSDKEVSGIVSPYNMSDEFYETAAKQALSRKDYIGRVKVEGINLGYRVFENRIVFLDISRETEIFNRLVWTFLWVAVPLLFLIFLSSLYFANRSIHPIEIAFTKQKEFIADASHELKTPLATISTNADVLLQEVDEPSKKWASHIKTESGRMASLVASLLYLAKIDYEDKPEFAPIDLSNVLSDVLLPLEAIIHEKKIDLQVDCANNVVMNGDKTQIHSLLGILIDNAIKYTDEEINMKIEKIGSHAQIIVQNSGELIPPEKLDKLFDRFYRIDESHQYTGSFGLGLSIAKAIVDAHNGKIVCKSDETSGTKFIIKF